MARSVATVTNVHFMLIFPCEFVMSRGQPARLTAYVADSSVAAFFVPMAASACFFIET
jgi:hypothetical protein